MDIIEIILLIVAWLITLTWMYGVRVKPVVVTTSLVSLVMLSITLFFSLTDFSEYHLIWVMPLTIFIGSRIFVFITVHIPVLNTVVITLGKVYTEILRIGISKNARDNLQKKYETNMTSILDELSAKKQKEFKNSKDKKLEK